MNNVYDHTCPKCHHKLYPKTVTVEYVEPDGCRRRGPGGNIRTRDHLGNGNGSFHDEITKGIKTPWSNLKAKENALKTLSGSDLSFAEVLSYVIER